jgi:LEM3 (ligand-effect modulator 3) family / CDC50 family
MRTSGLPNFRKLWGHIDEALDVGTYTVTINSYYDISSFSGKKFVVISTANALGGDNTFLGIAYIVVGGITLILALAFVVRGYFFRKSDQIHSS